MVVVIFEVYPAEGRVDEYLDIAASLREELATVPGFVRWSAFAASPTRAKLLSASTSEDEQALARWRCHHRHRRAQAAGRGGVFADYRLRVAAVR